MGGGSMTGYDEMGGDSMTGYDEMGGDSMTGDDEMGGDSMTGYDEMGGESMTGYDEMGGDSMTGYDETDDDSMTRDDKIGGEIAVVTDHVVLRGTYEALSLVIFGTTAPVLEAGQALSLKNRAVWDRPPSLESRDHRISSRGHLRLEYVADESNPDVFFLNITGSRRRIMNAQALVQKSVMHFMRGDVEDGEGSAKRKQPDSSSDPVATDPPDPTNFAQLAKSYLKAHS
eukprot:gene1313-1903_t